MRITFDVDDSTVSRMFAELNVDEASMADAGLTPEQAAALIARAALDSLAGISSDDALVTIDRDTLARELGLIAGAQRPLAVDLETRGQPKAVWTPDARWAALDEAPERYAELEEHLASIFDLLATNPELATLVSRRWLPDNNETQEVFFAKLEESLVVRVRLADALFRFRIAPAGAIVIGSPEAPPERIRNEGR